MKSSKGFTLIELVVVIVILGILAATALPKFVDLGKDARVAAVKGLEGAISSAVKLAYSKCAATAGCVMNNNNGGSTITAPNGTSAKMFYGYPIGTAADGFHGLSAWTNIPLGYTPLYYTTSAGPIKYYAAELHKDDATDPDNCYIFYQTPSSTSTYSVTSYTSGC